MNTSSLIGFVLCVFTLIGPALAAEYYVAADGKPEASGTKDNPWDILSTLAGQKRVEPGDTVWLRGGTYRCEEAYRTKGQGYKATLSGSAEKPVVIRAAAGERATIDGGIVVQGDYLWLWDIEIAQPDDTPRVTDEAGSHPDLGSPSGGITIHGKDCRAINLLFRSGILVNRYKAGTVYDNFIVGGVLNVTGEGNAQTRKNVASSDQMPDEARPILLPNKYDERRANLAIFNWNKEAQVRVPAGDFLNDGERFRLMDPLDLYGEPVFEGKCEGNGFYVPGTDEFAVFVVLKD